MALYLLYESASGYALFHAHGLDEIGQNIEAVRNSIADLNRFGKVVQLTAFHPFESALDALNQCNSISEGPNFHALDNPFVFVRVFYGSVFWCVCVCVFFFGFLCKCLVFSCFGSSIRVIFFLPISVMV